MKQALCLETLYYVSCHTNAALNNRRNTAASVKYLLRDYGWTKVTNKVSHLKQYDMNFGVDHLLLLKFSVVSPLSGDT